MLVYTVTCHYVGGDPARWAAYLAWLEGGHLAEVVAAGALDARLQLPDGDPPSAVVGYRFASREAFAAYEHGHAPRLRGEGLERFPVADGFRYERQVAELRLEVVREMGKRAGRFSGAGGWEG